jgi:hypothetical protein
VLLQASQQAEAKLSHLCNQRSVTVGRELRWGRGAGCLLCLLLPLLCLSNALPLCKVLLLLLQLLLLHCQPLGLFLLLLLLLQSRSSRQPAALQPVQGTGSTSRWSSCTGLLCRRC